MFKYHTSMENEITRLLIYEQQSKSKFNQVSFTQRTFKGKKPILIVVFDKQNKKRANLWGKGLHKLFNVHILSVRSFEVNKISEYINKHQIISVIVFDLSTPSKEIEISTKNKGLISFLTTASQIGHQKFLINNEDVEKFLINDSVTLITLGHHIKFPKLFSFFSFFGNFIHFQSKIASDYAKSSLFEISTRSTQQNIPYNRVELNTSLLAQLNLQENDYVVIYNPLNFKFTIACIKSSKNTNDHELSASPSIKKKLELYPKAKIILHPLKKILSTKILIQNVKTLAEGGITVSEDIYQHIEQFGTPFIEIVNRTTSSSIDLEYSKIKLDKTLGARTIRLSYLQREFLDFEHPPNTLSSYYFNSFSNHPSLSEDQKKFFVTHYSNEKIHSIDTFEEKKEAKKNFQTVGYYETAIYPLPEKHRKRKISFLSKIFRYFLHWSIRPATLKLKVIRPYSTDESSNIVRVSKSVMSLLGIEENDLIHLNYRGRSITVPVLELNTNDLIKETNAITNESSINISIGIPAHLRDKLGIKQIGKICEVERNLPYLFRKNWNTQFLPIVAIAFTVYSLKVDLWWIKVLIMVFIIPVSSYIALSAVRERIPKL